jgi:transcriptional regulator with XRE-family HTH domain
MATTASTTFGALLRQHRLEAGLTQEGLAERAGVSARGVQDLERGVRVTPAPIPSASLPTPSSSTRNPDPG